MIERTMLKSSSITATTLKLIDEQDNGKVLLHSNRCFGRLLVSARTTGFHWSICNFGLPAYCQTAGRTVSQPKVA
jgi:hypothetical protein